jgi:hypothetical protein
MTDPFVVLRSELVTAAKRTEVSSPQRRWEWLRGRSRPLSVVIAALVICGSATAAVLSLTASSSQPLAGKVPGTIVAARPGGTYSVAGYRYRIVVTPSLSAGEAGWNTGIRYIGRGPQAGTGEASGGTYATASNPIFGGTGGGFVWTGQAQRGDSVGDVITGPQVAAVRIGNRTIRTFASTELPAGDRAAVFFLPAGSPQPTVGWRPGQPVRSYVRLPSGPHPGSDPSKWTKFPTVALLPLDASGRVLPTSFSYPDTPFPSFWQAPKAITPNITEPPYHGPTHPRASGVCQLGQHGLSGLTPVWGHTIARIQPTKDSLGELFLSCVDTEYYLHGWPLAAGVLLDARRPGQVLGALPGARAVPGVPGVVDFATASLSARRAGNAWLVVRGGSGSRQRLRVLEALRLSRLDLRG